jgi:hypothetical protein
MQQSRTGGKRSAAERGPLWVRSRPRSALSERPLSAISRHSVRDHAIYALGGGSLINGTCERLGPTCIRYSRIQPWS